ncbi:hypothetical protein [Aureimonas flava]|nr:hypothetical protein [Aureimonas flava]
MAGQPGRGQQSMNAGEFSPELAGRIDIKQYYSAGLRFLNVEPVAQAGFRNLPGTRRVVSTDTPWRPRFWRLRHSRELHFLIAVVPYRIDVFEGTALVARIPTPVTPEIAAEVSLYLEADTVGVFHRDLRPLRLVRQSNGSWTLGFWPFGKIPDQDYGGDYAKREDIWELFVRFDGTAASSNPIIAISVDGEAIEAQQLSGTDYNAWAAAIQDQLRALPSLNGDVVCAAGPVGNGVNAVRLRIVFGGSLAGQEFQITSQIVSTSSVSVLPSHIQIGKTFGEPLISDARGWPGVVAIAQDRLVYAALRERPSALLFSQTAEYFTVNTSAQRADGAKLEALRTTSKEEILHVKALQYLLVFTDEAEYFATNRTIARTEPLNFVETSRNGMARGTWPVEIENRVYYIGQRGAVLFSTAYDDIQSAFTARQESLLASHLVDDVIETAIQRGTDDSDSPRLWMLRRDGRLVGASIIRDQEITAFFEYDVGAPVRSIGIDAENRLWLAVDRSDGQQYEVMDDGSFLASGVTRTVADDGTVSDLPFAEGSEVWAEAGGYTYGPATVTGGAARIGAPGEAARIGIWRPPLWESMPSVLVGRDDKIVRRPGRIHGLDVNVIETTSIAIGANGTTPRDLPLVRLSDPADLPPVPKTELVTMAGIPGVVTDPTAVVTQVRPGVLRVRDVTFQEKL